MSGASIFVVLGFPFALAALLAARAVATPSSVVVAQTWEPGT